MASSTKKNPRISLFKDAVNEAKKKAGGEAGFSLIGPNLRHALVASEILRLQQRFNRMVEAAVLVETTDELHSMLNDEFPTID